MTKQQLIDLIYTLEEEAFERVWLHRKNENHYQDPNIYQIFYHCGTKKHFMVIHLNLYGNRERSFLTVL